MFAKGAASYDVLRFVLGAVESGLFPGVMLHLTFWYSKHRRACMVALFMSAVPVSGLLASPLYGWIL